MNRLDEATAMGTWRELKAEFSRNGGDDPKIADFAQEKNRRQDSEGETENATSSSNLLIAECRKEDSNLHPLARSQF